MAGQSGSRAGSIREWITTTFAPKVLVIADENVERACSTNGLSFADMLRPFQRTEDIDGSRDCSSLKNCSWELCLCLCGRQCPCEPLAKADTGYASLKCTSSLLKAWNLLARNALNSI